MPQGVTTLDSIIREACFEVDDNGLHLYQKFLMWGMEAVKTLNMDTVSNIKTVVLTTTSAATLPFPDDYLNWIKVGFKKGDRVQVMTVNEKLTTHHTQDTSGNDVNNTQYTANYTSGDSFEGGEYYGYWFWNVYYDGGNSGNIFGYGNGVQGDGEFKIDRENRRFQFDSGFINTQILLEYTHTGLNPSGDTMVDELMSLCVKLYILWKHSSRSKRYGLAERQMAKDEYYNERRFVGRRTSNMSTEDIVASIRNNYFLAPKT